jgi:hypothetical protein
MYIQFIIYSLLCISYILYIKFPMGKFYTLEFEMDFGKMTGGRRHPDLGGGPNVMVGLIAHT